MCPVIRREQGLESRLVVIGPTWANFYTKVGANLTTTTTLVQLNASPAAAQH